MLRIDRRLIAHFEWPLLFLTLLLAACGLLTILSATYSTQQPISRYVIRQALWIGVGLLALGTAVVFDYRLVRRYGYLLYAIALVLLLAVPLLGSAAGGAHRWLRMGPVKLQPSEFMRIAVVIAVSRSLHETLVPGGLPLRFLIVPLALLVPPAVLILRQPDLGTAAVMGLVVLTILLVAGLRLRVVLLAVAITLPVLPAVWNHLQEYQRQRIRMVFQPDADPLGRGYHIKQSEIAIGSGMLRGKGFLQGTQNRLNFVPEEHTDFIFTVFAEEWGFAGSVVLLFLYALVVVRGAVVASQARDNLGALLAAGLTGTIFWQAVINIGMTSRLLPVVGLTLPFFSYGGSSMVALMIAVGLLMNVSMRRFAF